MKGRILILAGWILAVSNTTWAGLLTGTNIVANGSNIQATAFASKPCVVDWNNDTKPDLIVGEVYNNLLSYGRIKIYTNNSSGGLPSFPSYTFITNSGIPLQTTGYDYLGASPRVIDWNRDGRKDLIVGEQGTSAKIRIYLNTGTDAAPVFSGFTNITIDGQAVIIDSCTPEVVDWNNDGKIDVISGAKDGRIYVMLNYGSETNPYFGFLGCLENDGTIKAPDKITTKVVDLGDSSAPVVADWDGDGAKDVISGAADGNIYLLLNGGADFSPDPPTVPVALLDLTNGVLNVGSNSYPDVADWDRNGTLDLIVGNKENTNSNLKGSIMFFNNTTGTNRVRYTRIRVADANTNSLLESGESANLYFDFRNYGPTMTNIKVVVSNISPGWCTVSTVTNTITNLTANSSVTNIGPFPITVNAGMTNVTLTLDLWLQAANYLMAQRLNLTTPRALVVNPDSTNMPRTTMKQINVLTNDSYAAYISPSLDYTNYMPLFLTGIESAPSNGTASIVSNKIQYTAVTAGEDQLTYRVSTLHGVTGTGVLSISVSSVPIITNRFIGDVGTNYAYAYGTLVDAGNTNTEVRLYWGPDGIVWWGHNVITNLKYGGSVYGVITGLNTNTTYYCTFMGTNSEGAAWATPAMSFKTIAKVVITDNDVDGMDDNWEAWYLPGGIYDGHPYADDDNDGVCNLGEYLAGTMPNSATSAFPVSLVFNGADVILSWSTRLPSGIGYHVTQTRSYYLESQSNMTGTSWQALTNITATGMPYTFTNPAVLNRNFYRIRVKLED